MPPHSLGLGSRGSWGRTAEVLRRASGGENSVTVAKYSGASRGPTGRGRGPKRHTADPDPYPDPDPLRRPLQRTGSARRPSRVLLLLDWKRASRHASPQSVPAAADLALWRQPTGCRRNRVQLGWQPTGGQAHRNPEERKSQCQLGCRGRSTWGLGYPPPLTRPANCHRRHHQLTASQDVFLAGPGVVLSRVRRHRRAREQFRLGFLYTLTSSPLVGLLRRRYFKGMPELGSNMHAVPLCHAGWSLESDGFRTEACRARLHACMAPIVGVGTVLGTVQTLLYPLPSAMGLPCQVPQRN